MRRTIYLVIALLVLFVGAHHLIIRDLLDSQEYLLKCAVPRLHALHSECEKWR